MSKNMAKIRNPACLPDNLTVSFNEYSTDSTEDEDDVEQKSRSYSAIDEYQSTPFCCRPRGSTNFTALDPYITRELGVFDEDASEKSYGMKSGFADLEPWTNFHIPESIPAGGYRSQLKTPSSKGSKVPQRMVQSYPGPVNSPQVVGPNLTRYSKIAPLDGRLKQMGGPLHPAANLRNVNARQNLFDSTQYSYSQTPLSYNTDYSSYAESDLTDVGPYRNIQIPPNLKRLNIPHGAHRTFPNTRQNRPLTTHTMHADKQPIIDLKEVAEHRRKAPRYYSTPKKDDFPNQGIDQSTIWGQDISSFQSAETSAAEDSSFRKSECARIDPCNVNKCTSPSPRNIKGDPRMIRSYPHLTSPSGKQDPNLTQYSKIVLPDSIGKQNQTYSLPSQNDTGDTFHSAQNLTDINTISTYSSYYQTPKARVTFNPSEYSNSQILSDSYSSQLPNSTYVIPGKQNEISPNLTYINVAKNTKEGMNPGNSSKPFKAGRNLVSDPSSYPSGRRTRVPRPSRNYLTYVETKD